MKAAKMRSFVVALLLLSGATRLVYAQSGDTAEIVGTVTDPSGAVLPNTTIKLTHLATGTTSVVVADQQGFYRTPPLRIGEYSIEVAVAGFKRLVRRGVTLNVGETRTVDLRLDVGQTSEEISVTAEAPLLETTRGSAGTVVENTLVRELPLNGRDYLQLAKISAGVLDPGSQQGALGVSVNGRRELR